MLPGEPGKMFFWASQPPPPWSHPLCSPWQVLHVNCVVRKEKALLSHLAHFFLTGVRWIITRKPSEYFICKLNFCRNSVNPLNPKIQSLICCSYNWVSYRVGNIIYWVLGYFFNTWRMFYSLTLFKVHSHSFVNCFWKACWGCYY